MKLLWCKNSKETSGRLSPNYVVLTQLGHSTTDIPPRYPALYAHDLLAEAVCGFEIAFFSSQDISTTRYCVYTSDSKSVEVKKIRLFWDYQTNLMNYMNRKRITKQLKSLIH